MTKRSTTHGAADEDSRAWHRTLLGAWILVASACGSAPPITGSTVESAIDGDVRPTTTLLTPAGQSWWDPEVLRTDTGALLTWQNERAEIWLAELDRSSGLVVPGSERRLGERAAPLLETYNGPEFGLDSSGWSVFFTRVEPGGSLQAVRARLHGGELVSDVVTRGDSHFSPLASKDSASASTRLVLLRRPADWGTVAWLDLGSPLEVHDLFHIARRSDADIRWVDGGFQLVTNGHPALPGEVAALDTGGGAAEQVSAGEGAFGSPYGWWAPETGGALHVVAITDDQRLTVWRRGAAGWSRAAVLTSPESALPYVGSPEPFVMGGRSYLSLVVADEADPRPGASEQHVWVIGIDPEAPLALRCDDGRPGPVTRVDPEVWVGTERVFVYYYEVATTGARAYACALELAAAERSVE
jgi:hypothetical protein